RGLMLVEARRLGWDVVGVEEGADACDRLRSQRLAVVQGEFLDVDLTEASFDVVMLQQVIEHSTSPQALLQRARGLLKPEGILYVGTPNSTGLLARARGERFGYWIPPEHVFHYGPRSLRYLLERNGFEVAALTTSFCESALNHDLRDIARHHPWLRRLPRRITRRVLEAVRPFLERLGDGTLLEAFARPAASAPRPAASGDCLATRRNGKID
ncbi:MAG: class I SAM-dependent methyltransferase, partial [Candidatus Binatia bacterium]